MPNADLQLAMHFLSEEPKAAAHKLEVMDVERAAALLEHVPIGLATSVLPQMFAHSACAILLQLSTTLQSQIFEGMNVADISAILRHAAGEEQSRLMELLPLKKQAMCSLLISYPSSTIGALCETDVLVVDGRMRVDDALVRARKKRFVNAQHVMVLTDKKQVQGSLSVYDLLRSGGDTYIEHIMQPPLATLSGMVDISTADGLTLWQQQDVVAVVNRQNAFIGLLYHHALRHALNRSSDGDAGVSDNMMMDVLESYSDSIMALMSLIQPSAHK